MDSSHQALVLILMILCPEDVCKVRDISTTRSIIYEFTLLFFLYRLQVRFGELSENGIAILRLIRDSFGAVFKIKEDPETNTVMISCLGTGYRNVSRRAT